MCPRWTADKTRLTGTLAAFMVLLQSMKGPESGAWQGCGVSGLAAASMPMSARRRSQGLGVMATAPAGAHTYRSCRK
jgi:hypothetical protein